MAILGLRMMPGLVSGELCLNLERRDDIMAKIKGLKCGKIGILINGQMHVGARVSGTNGALSPTRCYQSQVQVAVFRST